MGGAAEGQAEARFHGRPREEELFPQRSRKGPPEEPRGAGSGKRGADWGGVGSRAGLGRVGGRGGATAPCFTAFPSLSSKLWCIFYKLKATPPPTPHPRPAQRPGAWLCCGRWSPNPQWVRAVPVRVPKGKTPRGKQRCQGLALKTTRKAATVSGPRSAGPPPLSGPRPSPPALCPAKSPGRERQEGPGRCARSSACSRSRDASNRMHPPSFPSPRPGPRG